MLQQLSPTTVRLSLKSTNRVCSAGEYPRGRSVSTSLALPTLSQALSFCLAPNLGCRTGERVGNARLCVHHIAPPGGCLHTCYSCSVKRYSLTCSTCGMLLPMDEPLENCPGLALPRHGNHCRFQALQPLPKIGVWVSTLGTFPFVVRCGEA